MKVVWLAYLASQAFTLFCALWIIWFGASPTIHSENTCFFSGFFFFFSFVRSFIIFKLLYCSKQRYSLFYLTVYIGDLVNWFAVRIHLYYTLVIKKKERKENRRASRITAGTKCLYHLQGNVTLGFQRPSCPILLGEPWIFSAQLPVLNQNKEGMVTQLLWQMKT